MERSLISLLIMAKLAHICSASYTYDFITGINLETAYEATGFESCLTTPDLVVTDAFLTTLFLKLTKEDDLIQDIESFFQSSTVTTIVSCIQNSRDTFLTKFVISEDLDFYTDAVQFYQSFRLWSNENSYQKNVFLQRMNQLYKNNPNYLGFGILLNKLIIQVSKSDVYSQPKFQKDP
jgi:hypothetical protein